MRPSQLVSVAEAATRGITKTQLRGPWFVRIARGIHARHDHPDPGAQAVRTLAAMKKTHPEAMACSLTALRLHGVAVPDRLDRDRRIHVLVPAPGGHPRVGPGVRPHWSRRIASVPRRDAWGLRCSDPVEAWMQAAQYATVAELVIIGDGLMRLDKPLATLGDLESRVARARGRRHIRKLRQALTLIRVGTDSPRETWLRLVAADAGLPEPSVNQSVYDARLQFLARFDLYWEDLALAAEYDGHYHELPGRRIKDNERRRRVEAAGIRMVVATKADYRDPSRLIAALRQTAARPGIVPVPAFPGFAPPH
jgi:hypothetical protein